MNNITLPKNIQGITNAIWENDRDLTFGTVLQNINVPLASLARMQCTGRKRNLEVKLRLRSDDWYEQKTLLLTEKNYFTEYLGTPLAVWLLSLFDTPLYELQEDIKIFQSFDQPTILIFMREFVNRMIEGSYSPEITKKQIDRLFGYSFESFEKALETEEGAKKLFEQDMPNSVFNFIFDLQERQIYFEWLKSKLKDFEIPIEESKIEDSQLNLKWIGTNETEFVQFAYALFHSDTLKNENEQITKFVPTLAKAFNLELGNNWLDNHSKSVKKRNLDYKPEIFDKIKDGYDKYLETNKAKTKKN